MSVVRGTREGLARTISGRPVKRGSGTKGTDYVNKPYQPKHGRWVRKNGLWRCSECHLEQIATFKRCPMCGAVMDK